MLRTVQFGLMPLTSFDQVGQQLAPLCSELVGTRQTAVTSNHAQVGDAQLDQVAGGLGASLFGTEVLTAGTTNHSPTLMTGKEEEFQYQKRNHRETDKEKGEDSLKPKCSCLRLFNKLWHLNDHLTYRTAL